ncbi:MAG TPA: helix-turn-helix transcriptional regulator [Verrucomicrobiae bacterium]|nr:helix-turn-helix transcriptional regulator [Verrucomicrobiae bacterium]
MRPVSTSQIASAQAPIDSLIPSVGVSELLQALGDPIRLAIVRTLGEAPGPRPCGSFDLPVTKSTLTHHFRVLREAGLIEQRCHGTRKLTRLRDVELEVAYPGLLASVIRAAARELSGRGSAVVVASGEESATVVP